MRRVLASWICACLVAGTMAAATTDGDSTTALVVGPPSSEPRDDVARLVTPAPTTTSAAPSPTSTTAARVVPAPPAAPLVTTTVPPLVARTVTVDGPGLYLVSRDGTSSRRVRSTCDHEESRTWFGPDVFVVNKREGPITWHWTDGRAAPWEPLPPATDRWGGPVELRGTGSPSPDGRKVVVTFDYGAAIVDLVSREVEVVSRDDVYTAVWLPNGSIVLTGLEGTAVLDGAGRLRRGWAGSDVSLDTGLWRTSPDGRLVIAPREDDLNRWVIWDPSSNAVRAVPQLGVGWNWVTWAGPDRVVIGDPGVDHQIQPSLHVLDLDTGTTRRIADAATGPVVPSDGRVVTFFDRLDHQIVGLIDIGGQQRSTLVRATAGLSVGADSWSPGGHWLLVHACPWKPAAGGLPTT